MNETPHIPEHPEKKSKRFLRKIFLTLLFLIVILGIGGGLVTFALAAYDKVSLGNPKLQAVAREAILSLPFAPKTPAFVIQKMAENMSNVHTARVDASIALSSSSLTPIVGKSDLDMTLKGSFDKTDSKNIKTQFTVDAGTLFSADIKTGDKKAYIKVNTIPTNLLSGFMPASNEVWNSALSNWVVWDTNTLDSEARRLIDQNKSEAQKDMESQFIEFLNNKELIAKFNLSEETLDGHMVYKLHPTIDAEFVKMYVHQFGTKDDQYNFEKSNWIDSLNNLNVDIYINKDSYYVEKLAASFVSGESVPLLSPVANLLPNLEANQLQVATVVKLGDYNAKVVYQEPEGARTLLDVLGQVTSSLQMPATESGTLTH